MPSRRLVLAVSGYVLAVVALTWPLAVSLTTHLPGDPAGDTGVYAWNLWIFAQQVWHADGPFFTNLLFPLTGGVDLSLHNYTVASNLLALPLIGWLGTIGAFNVVFMLQLLFGALGVYALALEVTDDAVASWVAGLLFAFSPVLTARGAGHFSLVAAAALPFFALSLLRAVDGRHPAWAGAAGGACVAWASYSDPYYGVYCLVIFAVIAGHRALCVVPAAPRPLAARERVMVGLAGALAIAAVTIRVTGGTDVVLADAVVHARTGYTPLLVATACLLAVGAGRLRPRLCVRPGFPWRRFVRFGAVTAPVALLLLSPQLAALLQRYLDGRWVSGPQYWRSTTPGLDLLALVVPNPSSALWGGHARAVLEQWRPESFPEFVGSLPLFALAAVAIVRLYRGHWQTGTGDWLALFAVSVLCSFGPFLTIAGINTQVPGPWSVLRYVPVLGWARAPSRFAVLSSLALCVLFAFALRDLRRHPRVRTLALAPLLAVLALEHASLPHPVYAAVAPDIYDVIAADPDPRLRVLELPCGVRDGLKSIGNARPLAQYYQTRHGKPLIGGYLSRISEKRRRETLQIPTMRALIELSQGSALEPDVDVSGRMLATRFVQKGRVGYVVINRRRASEELRSWAIDALGLTLVAERDGRELYRPAAWPPEP